MKISSIMQCVTIFYLNKNKGRDACSSLYTAAGKASMARATCCLVSLSITLKWLNEKKHLSYLWSNPRKKVIFKFYAFISNIFIWLIAATLLFSHKAYITFCKEFNKLTIFLATTQRGKKKTQAHCNCINHKSSLTWIKCIKSISVSGILPKTFENHE